VEKVLIAPSLLAADFGRLSDEARRAEAAGADLLHIDVMDGRFVPNLTFGPDAVLAIRKATSLPLDVHLMVESPDRLVSAFADAGADYLTIHAEAEPHLHRGLEAIRKLGRRAGVAVNPGTSMDFLPLVAGVLDLVLIMTVNPGFGGQSFIEAMVPKIARARAELDRAPSGASVVIEVDGGITPANAAQSTTAGARILVAGSSLFGQRDLASAILRLREAGALSRPAPFVPPR
jgi:ribulose-phosphate 3-epimerase